METALIKQNEAALSVLDRLDAKDKREAYMPSIVERQHKTEFEAQLELARQTPRSIGRFLQEIKAMATINEDIAGSCIYALPRSGKPIEGPSVRLAEMALNAWGNCKAASRIIEDDGKMITAQGVFIDFQRNNCVSVEVKRRVTDKNGQRFNDDMIVVTSNAACAIAYRNVVFKAIPSAFVKEAYQEAKAVAVGSAATLSATRAKMLGAFAKMGIFEDRVLAAVGAKTVDDIDLEKMALLRGLYTAVHEGDTSADEAFPEVSSLERAREARGEKKEKPASAPAAAQPSAAPASAKQEAAPAEAKAEAKPKAKQQAAPAAPAAGKATAEAKPQQGATAAPAAAATSSPASGGDLFPSGGAAESPAEKLLTAWSEAGISQDAGMAVLRGQVALESLGLTEESTVFDLPEKVVTQLLAPANVQSILEALNE